ncbi:MAG: glutamate synthase [Lachnospiraceae bacterium]|nr:glutamate synthase [Lachnospiraceae bacterium]
MILIDAKNLDYQALNDLLRESKEDSTISGCLGQRFIAAGMDGRTITINGIPGNALGAYLNGADLIVNGNTQDAVGDTMNAGKIVIHGNIGDAAGYAMRGGKIFIRGNAGYRAGIHMKEYKEKVPVMIIGGCAGSFLGEYQAGGKIIVLGLNTDGRRIIGNFPCTGMHGGKMYLRGDCTALSFPHQVTARLTDEKDMEEIRDVLSEYCEIFGCDLNTVLDSPFTVVTPDSKNPYKQMYVAN